MLERNSLPKWISNCGLIKQENVQAKNPNYQRMARRSNPEMKSNEIKCTQGLQILCNKLKFWHNI